MYMRRSSSPIRRSRHDIASLVSNRNDEGTVRRHRVNKRPLEMRV